MNVGVQRKEKSNTGIYSSIPLTFIEYYSSFMPNISIYLLFTMC